MPNAQVAATAVPSRPPGVIRQAPADRPARFVDAAPAPEPPGPLARTLSVFHQPWWLSAVTGGSYQEAVVLRDGAVVARMPFQLRRHRLWRFCDMPPFTRTLGPVLTLPEGDTWRSGQRHGIVDALIRQLPRAAVFRQVLDPGIGDGLAFQAHDCRLGVQYTALLDGRVALETLWRGLRDKTRNAIRRAQGLHLLCVQQDSAAFLAFYRDNLRSSGRASMEDLSVFPALHAACRARQAGEIWAALDGQNRPAAMAFFVWDAGTLHYLLSTRAPEADAGAVSLLLWQGIIEANRRGLRIDLDGLSSPGRARFLAGFGGRLAPRLVVHKVSPAYGLLRALKACARGGEPNHYD